jgi:hypothetical protein
MKIQSIIPPSAHQALELKACYIKLEKIGDVYQDLKGKDRRWAFDAIKETQKQANILKNVICNLSHPFTSLKYKQ